MRRNWCLSKFILLGLLMLIGIFGLSNSVGAEADKDVLYVPDVEVDPALGAAFYIPFENKDEPLENRGLVATGARPVTSLTPTISTVGVKGNCFDNSVQVPETQQEIIVYRDPLLQAALREVGSFTITFWIRTDKFYQHGRLLHIPGLIDVNHSDSTRIGVLFEGPKEWRTSDAGLNGHNYQARQWRFVAIVYDGTSSTDNFRLYYGSQEQPVTLDSSYSVKYGLLSASDTEIILGNIKGGHRPFPGYMDEVRVWLSKGSDGALDQEGVEAVRQYDVRSAFVQKEMGDAESSAVIFAPDFSTGLAGFQSCEEHISIGIADRQAALHIKANNVQKGSVTGPSFPAIATHRIGMRGRTSGWNMTYWDVRYTVRNELLSGSYRMVLRITNDTYGTVYEIDLEHVAGQEVNLDGVIQVERPLVAVCTTHPNLREAVGDGQAELVIYLEDGATGDLFVSDVLITSAQPGQTGYSSQDWETFESGDGIHYLGIHELGLGPNYAERFDYVSEPVMDTVYKLLAVAGFNLNRQYIYWEDPWEHRQEIGLVVKKNELGYYDVSQLYDMVTKLHYYGIESMICLRGSSPEWTHPGFSNLHRTGLEYARDHQATVEKYGELYPGPMAPKGSYWVYPPDDWADYREFVAAVAEALKGKVLVYEVLNEPVVYDSQDHPIGGYKALAEWVRHFYEVVKTVDPGAEVIIGHSDQLLLGLLAEGTLQYCDGIAYHLYSGVLESIRGVLESYGEKKHIWMTEYVALYPELVSQVRNQTLWNAFSVSDWDYGQDSKILTLVNSKGEWVQGGMLRGVGDRVVPIQEYYNIANWSGKLPKDDPEGRGSGRIRAEITIEKPVMKHGESQVVVLRATNNSDKVFHNVRLWPVGFVDCLGFDMGAIRAADVTIEEFMPGEVREIVLEVTPGYGLPLASHSITRGPIFEFPDLRTAAEGTYLLGLAVVNDEGNHSLVLEPLEVQPLGAK